MPSSSRKSKYLTDTELGDEEEPKTRKEAWERAFEDSVYQMAHSSPVPFIIIFLQLAIYICVVFYACQVYKPRADKLVEALRDIVKNTEENETSVVGDQEFRVTFKDGDREMSYGGKQLFLCMALAFSGLIASRDLVLAAGVARMKIPCSQSAKDVWAASEWSIVRTVFYLLIVLKTLLTVVASYAIIVWNSESPIDMILNSVAIMFIDDIDDVMWQVLYSLGGNEHHWSELLTVFLFSALILPAVALFGEHSHIHNFPTDYAAFFIFAIATLIAAGSLFITDKCCKSRCCCCGA